MLTSAAIQSAHGHLAPLTLKGGDESSLPAQSSPRLSLNPLFVAWLMGWRWYLEGWSGSTSSASSGMALSPSKPPPLSKPSGPSSLKGSEAA